ncbi:MAG TPA: hypothetical protein VL172_02615 [Kofleriaceae bacterium]|nr:hypothetical protein [Kofleriaceae bacterium]
MRRTTTATLVLLSLALAGEARAGYFDSATTYNYSYAPTYSTTLSDCDDCVETVNLPWSMPFFGRNYSQITISTNGWVRLGAYTGSSYAGNPTLTWNGSSAAPGPVIAPLWDDWSPAAAGSIYYGASGSAFVVEWWGVYHYTQTTGSSYTFELKLFADGRIEFHYGNMVGGSASWDYGASATIGLQEDVDTIAKPISNNSAWTGSNSARGMTRPGPVGFYMSAKDGFYSPNRARPNLKFRQNFKCGSTNYYLELVTSSEWNWVGSIPCSSPALSGDHYFVDANTANVQPTDTAGFDVATIEGWTPTSIAHGTYRFVKRNDFTPAPTYWQRWNVSYNGESTTYTSKLDYWDSGSFDKPVLILTGFDPLNESSTAEYLVLMGDLARTALAEGRDIAIGKYGDGNRRISWFHDEVGRWTDAAYVRNGSRKIQLAGVSMGGVLARGAIAWNNWNIGAKVSAWYSVDAPQTGANLGRTDRGLQNLVICNKPSDHPYYRMLSSRAAADMMYRQWTSCTCDDEPENSSCSGTSAYHDEYYGSIGWPTAIPRHALVFGDGNASDGFSKLGSGNLYDFSYGGICSEDRDWPGSQRDCNAGSRYVTASMINTYVGDIDGDWGLCDWFNLSMRYEPAFINVDSSWGLNAGLGDNTSDSGCGSNYGTLNATYWNGWAANGWNEYHKVMSAFTRDWMLGVIRAFAP